MYMKNSATIFSNKIFVLIVAVIALVLFGSFTSYIQTAFGWTNPTCTPPNCAGALYVDSTNGNVGIKTATASGTLTVNGTISAMGNWLKDVRTPSATTDGVNKAYVDTAVAGAGTGGGGVVTIFGVSGSNVSPQSNYRTAQSQANCFIGTSGLICGGLPGSYGIAAGANVKACSTLGEGWQEAFPGYGPHGAFMSWFSNTGIGDPEEVDAPIAITSPTYSTCSESPFQYLPGRYSLQVGAGRVYNSITALSACVTSDGNNPTPANSACNTCRVCFKP
jgi:hypothetical protein